MTAWILALWGRLPARLRLILGGIGALIAGAVSIFLLGRRRGREQGQAEATAQASAERAQENIARIDEREAAGDDEAVQRELARATERAKGRKRR